ncbi:MAG: OsmC family protein [Dehalococcoidia bacterium]|nr:OsmC family protein [Dehalococcoidia bacterium]
MRPRELRTVVVGNSYHVEVRSDHHRWVLDEPTAEGGTDAGPTPVESFLGALLSCLTVAFQFHARRQNIPVERIEGWVAGTEKRFLANIAVELEVWSPAPAEQVQALLPLARRGCFVSDVLKPEIDFTVEIAVYPPAAGAAAG